MLTICELQDVIMKFLNDPSENILIMQVAGGGVLIPYLGIQPTSKVKSSYFIKRQPTKITENNYKEMLILGDMAPKPLDELAVLVEEVIFKIDKSKMREGMRFLISLKFKTFRKFISLKVILFIRHTYPYYQI